MSTTHSSFDQYCIHTTISHRSAAAAGPEVHRECTITYFPALPFLATNPGDATADCALRTCIVDLYKRYLTLPLPLLPVHACCVRYFFNVS